MLVKEPKKILSALALSSALILTGCGSGGGSSSGGSSSNPPPEPSTGSVAGPLDAVQEPLDSQVFAPLADAAAGTPLEGTLNCASDLLVTDFLDVLDSFLVLVDPASLQNPQALFAGAAPQLQATITDFAGNLPGLLASFTGEECSGSGESGGGSENPLAGTPLAPLGDALAPALAAFPGAGGGDMDIGSLSALVAQLSAAFSDGLATVYAQDPSGELQGAPVLGGLLTTLDVALADLAVTVAAAEDMDTDATATAVSATLNHLLNNVLTGVVPIALIEEQAGTGPVFSGPIADAVASLTGLIGGDFSGFNGDDFTALFTGGFDQLLAAFSGGGENGEGGDSPLAALQALFEGALAGGLPLPAGGTGTPLDALLSPLVAVLDALTAGGGTGGLTGTPLDVLFAPLVAGFEGPAGACPLATTPLAPVCSVVDGLLSQLSANPGSDPLAILEGLVATLLGGLAP